MIPCEYCDDALMVSNPCPGSVIASWTVPCPACSPRTGYPGDAEAMVMYVDWLAWREDQRRAASGVGL